MIHVAIQHIFTEMSAVAINRCSVDGTPISPTMLSALLPYFCSTHTFVFILPAAALMTHSVYGLQLNK
jgi:hypothetical protein